MNLYQGQGRIMLAAPLPGLEPSNFHIAIDGRLVSLKIDLRGSQQENAPKYFQREWVTGPYSKIVQLPVWVDATKANATYDNGVLVLILPVAQASTSSSISMAKVGTAKGQAIGHVGQDFPRETRRASRQPRLEKGRNRPGDRPEAAHPDATAATGTAEVRRAFERMVRPGVSARIRLDCRSCASRVGATRVQA